MLSFVIVRRHRHMIAYVCNASQLPHFHKVYFYLFFKSNFIAGMSYLMWNSDPCSHGSVYYCVPLIACSGLGYCEETSGGMSCGV
jgi:hypothetical protein